MKVLKCIAFSMIASLYMGLSTTFAHSTATIPVAVLNFTNQAKGDTEWSWLEKGLADLLISDLSQHPQLQLVSREQMQLALLRMEYDGAIIPEWQEKISKQLKASRAVFGTYRIDEKKARIQATILDVLNDSNVGTVAVEGSAQEILKLEKQLAVKLLNALTDQANAQDFIDHLPVWTDSIPASKLLYEGVDHFDYGRYEDAWLYFRRALRQDPDYADAQYWGARMYYYQLRYEHALVELRPFLKQYCHHPRTADAIREIVDSASQTITTPAEALDMYKSLREDVSDHLAYEPHGFSGTQNFMPAKIWLSMKIAQVYRYMGDHWNTWKAYHAAHSIALSNLQKRTPNWDRAMETRHHVCDEWDRVLINGRELVKEFPDEAFLVTPENRVFIYNPGMPDPNVLMTNVRLPSFVAQQGYLIVSVTVSATFDSECARIHLRGKEGIWYSADKHVFKYYLGSPNSEKQGYVSRALHFDRGMSCIGFNINYFVYKPLEPKSITFTCELIPIVETASIVPKNFTIEDCGLHAGPLYLKPGHAFREDLFPDSGFGGWLPKTHNLRLVLGPHYPYEGHKAFTVELKPGQTLHYPLAESNGRTPSVERFGREIIGIIARQESYPNFLLSPKDISVRSVSPARTSDNAAKTSYIPIESYSVPRIQIIKGPQGSLHAFWHWAQDLWQAQSSDEGHTWSGPERIPVPVNSAHREYSPQIIRDHNGRYCLFFVSDRNILRRFWPYISISQDLKEWSRPRKISEEEMSYCFVYQDHDDNYILLSDGQNTLREMISSDLTHWSAPQVIVSCEDSLSLYQPYVTTHDNGTYEILFHWMRRETLLQNTSHDDERYPILRLVVGNSEDGRHWGNWRVVGPEGANLWSSHAYSYENNLIISIKYQKLESLVERGPFYPCDVYIARDSSGNWWESKRGSYGVYPWQLMPSYTGMNAQMVDGRIIITAPSDNSFFLEVKSPELELQRTRFRPLPELPEFDKLFK